MAWNETLVTKVCKHSPRDNDIVDSVKKVRPGNGEKLKTFYWSGGSALRVRQLRRQTNSNFPDLRVSKKVQSL